MKKSLLLISAFFAFIFCSAQEVVLGDMNGDGQVTIGDVTEVVNTVTGKSAIKKISCKTMVAPNAPDTELLAGSWRSIMGEKITLNADGTATHSNMQTVKTYEYYPYGRMLVLLNSGGYVVEVYDVIRTSENFVVMCVHGTNNYICYYSNDSYASGITLSSTTLAMNTGESKLLTLTTTPPNSITPLLTWSSSNTNVATVDQNGKVTAVGNGSCIITAKANDGSGLIADCSVVVTQLVTGITLSETTLRLSIDSFTKLTATVTPADATNKNVTWSSSNESVAEVSSRGVVSVNGYGKCDIICTACDGNGVSAVCKVIVEKFHEYVDLGLPSGLKWATCNVGANFPEEYGDYFAWGATEPQELYDWVYTPYQTQYNTSYSSTRYTKYLGSTSSSYKDPSAKDADALKTVLDPEDDAAHVNWGGDWRMPTKEEQDELRNNCYWKWVTSYNGKSVNGYIVYKVKDLADKGMQTNDYSSYSPVGSYTVSDPHLFLPAAGYRYDGIFSAAGSSGSKIYSLNEKTAEAVDPTPGTDPTPEYTIVGKGTLAEPYTTEDIIKGIYNTEKTIEGVWVKGTILGCFGSEKEPISAKDPVESNIAIGNADGTNVIPVQLIASGGIVSVPRQNLNIVAHPELVGKDVWVYGDVMKYFNVAGIKYTSNYSFDGTDFNYTWGNFWSSSLDSTYPGYACGLYFYSFDINRSSSDRLYGRSVRPVRP